MQFPSFVATCSTRLARIIGLAALAAALVACSAIKLGYNNLGEVAYWWLDGYVDFTDEQSAKVREDLARLHFWHRTQELPRIGVLLQKLEELAPADIGAAQACQFFGQVQGRLTAVADRAEPILVTQAIALTPEQLQHLERKYEKNNATYRKEWVQLDPVALKAKRFEQLVERSETFYGRLEEPQRAALRNQLDKSVFDPRRTLAERQRRQQDLLQTLRKLAGQPVALGEARTLVRGYLQRVQEPPDRAYRGYREAVLDEGCRIASALHNITSAAQRESAVRRLRAYQRDLRELAAQP